MHTPQAMTRAQLARLMRTHVASHLYDDSGTGAQGYAIYALSDPRDIRSVRYVGQTQAPRRRLLQHLGAARLWLPDERPWWIKSPKLLPLYTWIRELHREEYRLPVMVISTWVATAPEARLIERLKIFEGLAQQLPLLNIEAQTLGSQIPLGFRATFEE